MSLFGAMHSVILILSLRIHDILQALSEEHLLHKKKTDEEYNQWSFIMTNGNIDLFKILFKRTIYIFIYKRLLQFKTTMNIYIERYDKTSIYLYVYACTYSF